MSAPVSPFEGFAQELDGGSTSPETVSLRLLPAQGLADDESTRRFQAYLGLYDVLAEALLDARPSPGLAADELSRHLQRVEAVEGPMHFAAYEKAELSGRQELMARMRGKEIAVTKEWMVPRLRSDIAAYRARIDALRGALERAPEVGAS